MSSRRIPIDDLAAALRRTYPELEAVAAAASGRAFLVGGAVRDLLLGRERGDLDVAVVGDAARLAAALGAETVAAHERFGTVKVVLDGHQVDLAGARVEVYARPGALPTVAPAHSIEADLARRDFTINAIAVPLADPGTLVDPHGGREDLEAGLVRVLHSGSFVDDPTRAIRAARYAARFGFEPDPETAALLRRADLRTVSAERREAELRRLAGEETAARGFELLAEWGLVELREGAPELMAATDLAYAEVGGERFVPRDLVMLAAALGPPGAEEELASLPVARPSTGVVLAARHSAVELLLAYALGAVWVPRYWTVWSQVELEIDGEDLIAAGVAAGPAIGRGLEAALHARLDGEAASRDEELAVALRVARAGD